MVLTFFSCSQPAAAVDLGLIDAAALKGNTAQWGILDTRLKSDWEAGHIPWEDFYTGRDRRPLPPAELKKLFAKHGVDTAKPVVYYCLGGVRSAYAWTVHHLAGLPEARNYKGGWEAWEKRTGQ